MIILRGRKFGFVRKVPKRYRHVDSRTQVWIALGTTDIDEARRRAPVAWDDQLAKWAARSGEASALADESTADRFQRIADAACARGLTYRTAAELACGTVEEVVRRAKLLAAEPVRTLEATHAILGAAERPRLMLSELVAHVEALPATKHEHRFKSEKQQHLWRLARDRAVKYAMAGIAALHGGTGDKPADDFTSEDAWAHHDWWEKRVQKEGLDIATANKDFSYVAGLITRYQTSQRVRQPSKPYAGIALLDKHKVPNRKLELSNEWAQEVLIDRTKSSLNGINLEALAIILIALESGCRQSEIHDLPPEAFKLNANIPHLLIRNEMETEDKDGNIIQGREVKNRHSVREVPLVGVALDAARMFPTGFSRYRGKRTFSGEVNLFFRNAGLFPSKHHTIGGLRHSWESRMKKALIHSDDRAEMMGHSVSSERNRELYGDSMPLERRLEIAEMIMFRPTVM